MAIDDLLTALEGEAEAEVRRRIGEAERTAAAIAEEAREGVEERLSRAVDARESELRAQLEGELVEVRRRARSRVLEARRRFLDRVFEAAGTRLDGALEDPDYEDALGQVMRDGLACFGAGHVRVRCSPALETRIADRWGDREGLTVEADPSVGTGVELRAPDASLIVDGTLDDRLGRRRPALEIEVMARIREELGDLVG